MKLLTILFFSMLCATSHAKVVLTTYNSCTLDQQVDANTMRDLKLCLVDKVAHRRGRSYPIYIYLNSPGGSIYDGINFLSFAKTIKNLHTITQFSASMAAAISQGIPGKRYMTENGIYMFHRAKGSFSGQFEDGELESRLKMWKSIVRNMEQMQADRIGITLEDYKKKRLNEWWLYGKDAVKQNVSDGAVRVLCSKKLINQKRTVVVHSLFGSREIEKSNCPLVN